MLDDIKKALTFMGALGGVAIVVKQAIDMLETKDYIDIEVVNDLKDKLKKD